jgi:hypothetical protein
VPWRRFLRDGRVKVRRRRALKGSRPHHYKLLRGAVISRLAAELMTGDSRVEAGT